MNEVKWNTLDYIESLGGLGYSRTVERQRPGIAKAPVFPSSLEEGAEAALAVRSVLAELDAMIGARTAPVLAAFCWGTTERGGARLADTREVGERESLRICWNHNEIERIEIEPRTSVTFRGPETPIEAAALIERLVPMVWRHIRRGGELPPGIERFARFF